MVSQKLVEDTRKEIRPHSKQRKIVISERNSSVNCPSSKPTDTVKSELESYESSDVNKKRKSVTSENSVPGNLYNSKRIKLVISEQANSENAVKCDGSYFRKLIRGDHPLGGVRQLFAAVKNSTSDIIKEYLDDGGNILELILVIDKVDNKAYNHQYQSLFSVISLAINKCRDEITRLIPSTEEACKRLLRSHTPILQAMLAPSSIQSNKKVVLEMLTSIVTLSVQVAREVLCCLSLREVTMNDLAKQPLKYESNSVRAHFMRYVLSYFYHDSVLLIKQLLEQRHILQSIIFAGLTTDEAPLTILFLVTLKEKIVDNLSISKTSKLKMFNTKIMMKLLQVYTWIGPDRGKNNSKKVTNHEVCEQEREDVAAHLHELLVQLCTNHKLGVAFVDPTIGLGCQNYNELVFTVIKAMDPYWTVTWVRDLAIKILSACPDLVAPTFKHLGMHDSFVPKVSQSFIQKCEFAEQVIDNLNPERCLSANASPDQLTHLTIRVVFNVNVLNCVRASVGSVYPTLRLHGVKLLNSSFHTLHRIIEFVKARFTSDPQKFLVYSQKITDYIEKNVGLEEELMVAWGLGVAGDQRILKAPSEVEYFLPLLDLLLSYNQVFLMYLPPVFLAQLQATSLDCIDSHIKQQFHIKLIKFVIMFKTVQPSQLELNEMIKTLVCLLSEHAEARDVLRSLLLQTSYFEGVESEVDIWVLNLALFQSCDYHIPLLLSALEEAASKLKRCMKMLTPVHCAVADSEYNWDQLIEVARDPTVSLSRWDKALPRSRVSVLVAALVRTLHTDHCICQFITHLLADILFSQADIATYSQILSYSSSTLLEPIKQYISIWNDCEQQDKSTFQPFTDDSPECQLIQLLFSTTLTDSDISMFTRVKPEMRPVLVRIAVWHAVQGVVLDGLASVIIVLKDTSTVRELFRHPGVLQHFYPLQPPSNYNLSDLVLSLVPLVEQGDSCLLIPFRQRFKEQVNKAIRKRKTLKITNVLDKCKKLLNEKEDISSLLISIVEFLPELTGWTRVVEGLIDLATAHPHLLPDSVVTSCSQHTPLHTSLAHYLHLFPHQIQCLDTDEIICKQDTLGPLCSLVLIIDKEGLALKKVLTNNKKNVRVIVPLLAKFGQMIEAKYTRHLVAWVCEALQDPSPPEWLCQYCDTLGQYLASGDRCEEVFLCLQAVSLWTTAHVTLAKHVCVAQGQTVTFVTKTLTTLLSSTNMATLERAKAVCECLTTALADDRRNHDWQPVRDSQDWSRWVKLALKLGETLETEASFLLSTLTSLCAVVYREHQTGVSDLLEMVFSHSQFLPVLLAKPSITKTTLLELIMTLLQLDSSTMTSAHVPIYLSAYSASLSKSDQLLLRLLCLYESRGANLSEWKPMLWGEPAASFYSVRSKITPGLWTRQSFRQILELFDIQQVHNTVTNFPVHRSMKPNDKIKDLPDVYDPAFYLPMFVFMFAAGEVFYTYKTCQSGCMALILSALASHHIDVRTIAFVALQRCHSHLLSNTNNQDTLWLHFLNSLKKGLMTEGDVVPRLSSVVTVFLARTSLVLTQPSHPLYMPLSQYILAKPYFQLDTVPELLPLFNSVDIQLHKVHQEWILNILRDGIKDKEDFTLCLKSMAFKVILEYYSSTLASAQSKVAILEVLIAAVSVGHNARQLLVSGYGLCPWLYCAISEPRLPHTLLSSLLTLLCALLHQSSASLLVPLLCMLTWHQPELSVPQLTTVLAALSPYSLPRRTVAHLVDVVDSTVGGVLPLRTMLTEGITCLDSYHKEQSDVREYLKQIIHTSLNKNKNC